MRNPSWSRDEAILALDTYLQNDPSSLHKDHPAILELSRTLNLLGKRLQRNTRAAFRNPNGVYMKMGNFLHLDPDYPGIGLSSVSTLEKQVWHEYAKQANELHALADSIRTTLTSGQLFLDTGAETEENDFPEGALKYRQHVTRERNYGLVRRAKEQAKRKNGRLLCEVCSFDFQAVYGNVGQDYIECHHTIPVSELKPRAHTRISDMALLCANCHRMVHRRRPWLRMQQLRSLLLNKMVPSTDSN
jgi:5-methylcytosine-specific restriction protein A